MRQDHGSDLDGRVIVVTGAGRGLGLAIAGHLLDLGARVVAADREGERLEAAFADRRADPVHTVVCDITDTDQVAGLFGSLPGALWGLVNNAALADGVGGLPFWEIPPGDWRQVLGVNLDGTWLVSRAAAPHLIEAGEGRIVNLSSDAAFYGSPRLAHYIASKGAIVSLTRAMARDLGPYGVTVNAIAPGLTEGPSARTIPTERHELYAAGRALARPQVPEDICGAVAFLLSDGAGYVTGQTLVVDGGFVMP